MRQLRQGLLSILRGLTLIGILLWMLRPLLRLLRKPEQPSSETQPVDEEVPDSDQHSPEPGEDQEVDPGRRRLLALAAASAGGLTATAIAAPTTLLIIAPMFREEPPVWRPVGPVDEFEVGATVRVVFEDPSPLPWAGVTAASAAWLRRVSQDEFEAFSIYCTHLGCAVRWLEEANLFMCPCHGGVFKRDGEVSTGPARRPLARHGVRVREGEVEIRTLGLPVTGPIGAEPE